MAKSSPILRIHHALNRSRLLASGDKKFLLNLVSKSDREDAIDAHNVENEVQKLLKSLDWEKNRPQIARFTVQLMPFEELVPEVYSAWRPVVSEALYYLAENLPPQRRGYPQGNQPQLGEKVEDV